MSSVEQKTYPLEHHKLSVDKIDKDALYVMEKLQANGYVAYLVGGSVRDLLLNRKPKDFDISTSAQPEEIKKLFRSCILIGKRFRLAHIRFGRKILEVSTFRAGDVEADTLITRDNTWGSPEQDVLRRDFTINGLFYDSSTQTIIDYVGGMPDIEKKHLRTIGQPFIRFRQDPVRMIRLLKFQARFGFTVDQEARIALLENRAEITKSSPARILEELLRMLESGTASPFLRLMAEHGLLQLILPMIGSFMETEEGEEILSYLQEVDTTFHSLDKPLLQRSILMSCLVYPIFQKRIKERFAEREKLPHLGEIFAEANTLVHETFHAFLHIPKRLRAGIVSILTTQYRLTPLEKKSFRRIRIPHDPDFPLALQFLELRSCLEPALQKIYEEWSAAFTSPQPSPPSRRRRRRKRKPPP